MEDKELKKGSIIQTNSSHPLKIEHNDLTIEKERSIKNMDLSYDLSDLEEIARELAGLVVESDKLDHKIATCLPMPPECLQMTPNASKCLPNATKCI